MLTRIALPALAAAAALLATAPLTHDRAEARPAVWAPPPDQGNQPIERLRAENRALRTQLAQLETSVADGLDRLDSIARSSRDRRTAMRMQRAIADLRYSLGDDDRDGWGRPDGDWQGRPDGGWQQPPPPPNGNPGPLPPVITGAMSTSDFQRLQQQITAATFPADQMNVIGAAASRNRFTVDQVIALMRMMAFDDNRVEIAVLLAPRVVDGQRFYLTLDALQFPSSKDTLRQRVQF